MLLEIERLASPIALHSLAEHTDAHENNGGHLDGAGRRVR
jgi:hypothetical protein